MRTRNTLAGSGNDANKYLIVLRHQMRDILDEAILQVLLDLDTHSKVENAQLAVRRTKKVSRVRITCTHTCQAAITLPHNAAPAQ